MLIPDKAYMRFRERESDYGRRHEIKAYGAIRIPGTKKSDHSGERRENADQRSNKAEDASLDVLEYEDRVRLLGILDQLREISIMDDISLPTVSSLNGIEKAIADDISSARHRG